MNFLSNAPLGEDRFEGKSQELIADAIVNQLENNANQNHRSMQQKMIGVEGEWGSGKSNLIEIVKKKLGQNKKFLFFTYDVWGHQEDLQRKAILNELVDFLIEKKAIENNEKKGNPNNWKERVKKVTGTVTETTQYQVPKISWGIFFCAFILLIIPFCNQIAELEIVKSQQIPFIPFYFPLPVGIVLAPLILVVVLYILFVICKRIFYKKTVSDASAEFLSVYRDKQIETTDRTYVSEMNPSVFDFRNLLKALSDALIEKHLVVFLDNMDRLPKENVENLWSSIHTFFAENQGYKNISCIVSFDRSHIKRAFDVNGDDERRGDDYIDKTFDIVFRIAPPVLSDWKKFFEYKWKDAFGDSFNSEEYDHVIQIYDMLSDNKALTPRSIIKFINECILLKKTFNVPERYIAIFNLRKKELIKNSLDEDCLGNLLPLYKSDSKYHEYIAALVYQVPPEKAISAIYVVLLARALEQGNEAEIDKISKASFFEVILEDALSSIGSLPDAIVSLDKIKNIPLTDNRQKKLWLDLYFRSQSLMRFDSGKMEPFQNVLLKHLDRDLKFELTKNILTPYENVDFTKPRDIYGTTGKEYLAETYVSLLKKIEENIHRDELKGILHEIRIKPETYISLLKTVDDFDWIPFECIDLSGYISRLNYQEILELECLEKLPKEKKRMLDIGEGVRKVFANNQIYNEENLLKIFKIMVSAYNSKFDPSWLNWNLMAQLLKSTQIDNLKGMLLSFRLMFNDYPLPGNNPFDAMLKSDVSEEIQKTMFVFYAPLRGYGSLISNISLLKNFPIVRNYVQEHFTDDSFKIWGDDVLNILPKFGFLCHFLKIDMTLWISKIEKAYFENEKQIKKIFDIKLCGDLNNEEMKNILPYETIKILGLQETEFFTYLNKRLIAYFNSWDKEIWISKLKNVNLYGVKEAVLIKYEWSQSAKDAIESCLNDCVRESSCELNKEVWNQVVDSLEPSFKEHLFKNMRDELYSGRSKMNMSLFVFVGEWLFKYGDVGQVAGEVLRTIVPASLLESREAVQIIANHFDDIRDIFNEERDAKDWIEKAKSLSKSQENYPLKECLKSL